MPSAKGLFHRAAIQSGPGLKMVERDQATKVAELLLHELSIEKNQVRQLQEVPQQPLLSAYFAVTSKLGATPGLRRGFAPVVDGRSLPRHPFHPDAPSICAEVPILIGYNRTEATFFLASDPKAPQMTEEDLQKRVRALFHEGSERVIQLYRKLHPNLNPYELYVRINTDQGMGINSIRLAERKAAQGQAPVFLYNFVWETPVAGLHSPHTLEIPFVFNNIATAKNLLGDSAAARALGEKVSDAWVAFARTGNPSTAALPRWPAYTEKDRDTMLLDNESKVVKDPLGEKRLLLSELLKVS